MSSTITDRLTGAVSGIPVSGDVATIVALTQTGGTNDITCTAYPAQTDWNTDQFYGWRATAGNTGPMTITISGVTGTKALKKAGGVAMASGDITIGLDILMRYDGTEVHIVGGLGQGTAGANGATWLSGAGAPAGGLGSVNDFYINTTNSDYYKKTGVSTWTLQGNLQGIAGNNGTSGSLWYSGTGAPAGGLGAVNDFYINTSNSDYYKKTGTTTWTLQGNLQGAAGSGTGDVVGPAGAVNGRVAIFSGATGKLIADGGTLLSALLTSAAIGSTVQAWDADLDTIAALTTNGLLRRSGGVWAVDTNSYANLTGATFTGNVTTVASATGGAGLNVPHGAAPTSPVNGDFWSTTGGFFGRVNGTTVQLAPLASPTFTGTPAAPTAAVDTNTTQLATTAFVLAQAGSASPVMDGTATVGTSTRFARQDHVHPTDTSRAPVASPTFTGKATTAASAAGGAGFNLPHGAAPTAPANGDFWTTTAAVFARLNGTTVQLATQTDLGSYAPLASPTFTGTPAAPTAAANTNTTQIATTANVVATVATEAENAQTAAYTLALTDAGKLVSINVTGASVNLTIPTNASVAFPVGTRIDIVQLGSAQVTLVTTGITLQSSSSKFKLTGQYSGATLYKRATDTWLLIGDIA